MYPISVILCVFIGQVAAAQTALGEVGFADYSRDSIQRLGEIHLAVPEVSRLTEQTVMPSCLTQSAHRSAKAFCCRA